MSAVYLGTNSVNGKEYVGLTTRSLRTRVNEHRRAAECGEGFALHDAIRKHGFEAFVWTVLHRASSVEVLAELEMAEIAARGTMLHGYNLCGGGEGAAFLTPERREQLSNEMKSRWEDKEWRASFAGSMSARWEDEEWRANTSAAISKARLGQGRAVEVDGIEYASAGVAARALGVSPNTVANRANAKTEKWSRWKWIGTLLRVTTRPKNRRRVLIDGILYESCTAAKDALGMEVSCIYQRCKIRKWSDWVLVADDHNDDVPTWARTTASSEALRWAVGERPYIDAR